MSTSGQFENMICEAIETLVNRAVEKAGYDKTIQATIVEHLDSTIGKYKVKHQDSTFIAYATDVSANYSKGTSVYVLVPANDMDKDKTIIGAVEKLGLDYVPNVPEPNKYDENGSNIIERIIEGKSIGVCSYYNTAGFSFLDTMVENPREEEQKDFYTIYDAEDLANSSVSLIAAEQIEKYMRDSSYLICGATFVTKLAPEQIEDAYGTYGIEFELSFKNGEEIVNKVYRLDNNDMQGSPYHYEKGSSQKIYFQIDGENFVKINKIQLFCTKFPHIDDTKADDILVTNLLLQGANRVSDEDLNGCYLTLITPQGEFLGTKSGGKSQVSLKAVLRVKGKNVSSDQKVSYYWFRENPKITREDETFHLYGGLGWECLNKQTSTIETIDEKGNKKQVTVTDFAPMGNTFIVKQDDIISKFATYKCVAVYDENLFSAEKTLQNGDFQYAVELVTDSGRTIFNGAGNPIITCNLYDSTGAKIEDVSNFEFAWAQINSNGQFTSLSEKTDSLQVNMNQILTFATYKCSVYVTESGKTSYVGSAAITLKNEEMQELDLYSLVINNGSQVFKYNEAGISPASARLDNPLVIPELSFSLYDSSGELVPGVDSNIWYFPIENTMLKLNYGGETPVVDPTGKYYVVTNPKGGKLSYSINDTYNPSKLNNTIRLSVRVGDTVYTEATTFLFVKEGDSGTNGTDYVLRILPNVSDTNEDDAILPMLVKCGDDYFWNFPLKTAGEALKLQIWKSAQLIYEGTDNGTITVMDDAADASDGTLTGTSVNLEWVNLIHKYSSDKQDKSYITIDTSTNKAIFTGLFSDETMPANIIQARVVYNDAFFSATTPIITAYVPNTEYRIRLKDGAGFTSVVYSADGMFPQYNKETPFEVILEKKNDEGIWTEVFDNSEKLVYNWSILGKVNDIDVSSDYLTLSRKETENQKQFWTIPTERCSAECLSVAVMCKITFEDSDFAWIHIPIHFMLNRYGQAALNGWDGNSIDINEKGGYILSPQIGAGKKEEDNSFTGVFMGEVKEYKGTSEIYHTGILGYNKGAKSLFLNAEDGSAIFGSDVGGQIVIDPSSKEALLYSSNFFKNYGNDGKPINTNSSNESGEGLLINLSKPEIRYGNGLFSVDENGNLTAHSGTIAGWKIGELALYHEGYTVGMGAFSDKDEKYIKSDVIISNYGPTAQTKAVAFWAGGYKHETEDEIKINNPKFLVSHDGYLKAQEASIGDGYNAPIFIGSDLFGENSAIYSGNKNDFEYATATNGFYLGEDGLAIGSYQYRDSEGSLHKENAFQVTQNGIFTAREGFIGNGTSGWRINADFLNHGVEGDGAEAKTKLFSGENKDYFNSYQSGVYLGTKGIEVGVTIANLSFSPDSDFKGSLYARMYGIQIPGMWIKKGSVSYDSNKDRQTDENVSVVDASHNAGLVGINSGYLAGTWRITSQGIISDVRPQLYHNAPWFQGQSKPMTPEERRKIDELLKDDPNYTPDPEPDRWVSTIPVPTPPSEGCWLTSSTGATKIHFNPYSFGVSLLSNAMPDQINRSVYDWTEDEEHSTYSYQRIVAGMETMAAGHRETVPKDIKCFNEAHYFAWELLDDGSMYARKSVISTQPYKNFNSDSNGVYIGPEGLSVGSHFKINKQGDIIKGPTPITAIEIVSDVKYNVTTNGGVEYYNAILEE